MKKPEEPKEPVEYKYRNFVIKEIDLRDETTLSILDLQTLIEALKEPNRQLLVDVDHEKSYDSYDSCNYWAKLKVIEFEEDKYKKDCEKYQEYKIQYPILLKEYYAWEKEQIENNKILETEKRYKEYLRLKKEFEFTEKLNAYNNLNQNEK